MLKVYLIEDSFGLLLVCQTRELAEKMKSAINDLPSTASECWIEEREVAQEVPDAMTSVIDLYKKDLLKVGWDKYE